MRSVLLVLCVLVVAVSVAVAWPPPPESGYCYDPVNGPFRNTDECQEAVWEEYEGCYMCCQAEYPLAKERAVCEGMCLNERDGQLAWCWQY